MFPLEAGYWIYSRFIQNETGQHAKLLRIEYLEKVSSGHSASTDSVCLAWVPDTIGKKQVTSPEKGVPQARTIAGTTNA